MLLFMLLILLVLMFMLLMNLLVSKNQKKNMEMMTSFECGFDTMSMNRMPFSLQFYLITVIFLIFDVEIALLLPMISLLQLFIYSMVLCLFIIMFILLFGLLLEWKEGALNWFKN